MILAHGLFPNSRAVLDAAWKATFTKAFGLRGGQVVSVLTFYSDNVSSNPAEVSRFLCKISFSKESK